MSDFFEWNPAQYSVHVSNMDDEHQVLIGIMNKLHERHAAGAGTAELARLVRELGAYTVKHFQHEEAYMESIGFAKFASHKLIHKSLLEKFGGYASSFEASGKLDSGFFPFLKLWLKAHIQGIDRQYGESGLSRSA